MLEIVGRCTPAIEHSCRHSARVLYQPLNNTRIEHNYLIVLLNIYLVYLALVSLFCIP